MQHYIQVHIIYFVPITNNSDYCKCRLDKYFIINCKTNGNTLTYDDIFFIFQINVRLLEIT